jgi:hypothetical protein
LAELGARRDKILRLFEEHRASSNAYPLDPGEGDQGLTMQPTADCCQPQKCVQEHWT